MCVSILLLSSTMCSCITAGHSGIDWNPMVPTQPTSACYFHENYVQSRPKKTEGKFAYLLQPLIKARWFIYKRSAKESLKFDVQVAIQIKH